MANGTFHAGRRGVELHCHCGIEQLCHAFQQCLILDRSQNCGTQIVIALNVCRHAQLMNHLCHHYLHIAVGRVLRVRHALGSQIGDAAAQSGNVERLQHEVRRTLFHDLTLDKRIFIRRCDDESRCGFECLRFLKDLYGIHTRQDSVHHNHVRCVIPDRVQNDFPVFSPRHDVKTERPQFIGTGDAIFCTVISDQDFYFFVVHFVTSCFFVLPYNFTTFYGELQD